MKHARLVSAGAVIGACLVTLAGAAGAAASTAAVKPRPPAGYKVVISTELTAPDGADTRGTVKCPAGTVPFGGGAIVSSPSTRANVGSTFPSGGTWFGDIKNASGAATTFQVEVICGKRPKGYTVVRGANVVNPVGSQSRAVATCPAGTRPLGGGGTSNAFSSFVDMNRTGPKGRSWVVKENNASATEAELTAVVVCGKVNGYRVVTGPAFSAPAGGQKGGSAVCPAPTVPIGGGVFTTSKSVGVNVEGTIPSGDRWDSFMNNNTGFPATATAVAVCATR
jgi:hypothetical protein